MSVCLRTGDDPDEDLLSGLMQGRVTISNDGATIMKLLDIVHPAAKVLADISMSQDAEVRKQKACAFRWSFSDAQLGRTLADKKSKPAAAQVGDGTTTVVILAGELLKECKAFIEEGVHPQVPATQALTCPVGCSPSLSVR